MTGKSVVSTLTPEAIDRALPIYDPAYAFVVHTRRGERNAGNHQARQAVLTLHPVLQGTGSAPQIGPGSIMGEADLDSLRNRLDGDFERGAQRSVTVLPANVIAIERDAVTWFVPGAKRPMHYRTSKGKGETYNVVWPHLIFRAVKRTLYVAAVATAERPLEHTPLLHAPLANVNAEGLVCTGSSRLPRETGIASRDGWEYVIFGTYFTHPNHSHALSGGASASDLCDFWKGRVGRKTAPAVKNMTPMNFTLGRWLNGPARGSES